MRRAVLLAFIVAVPPACGGGELHLQEAPFVVGSRVSLGFDAGSISLRKNGETLLVVESIDIATTDDDLDRASWDAWVLDPNPDAVTYRSPTRFTARADGDGAVLDLAYEGGRAAHVDVRHVQDARFSFAISLSGPGIAMARVRARTSGDPKEGFYGMGEQEDAVDNRGKLRAMQLEADLGIESADHEAHVPIPLLIGTHGWGMFVASRRVGAFDVARKDPSKIDATFAVSPAPGDQGLSFWLFAEDEPIDLVKHYHAIAGAVPMPDPFVYGPWIWRNASRDQAQIEEDIATVRSLDLATSGMWLDRPYSTAVSSFDFDTKRFTDPQGLIDRAHAAGIAMGLWATPYLEPAVGAIREEAIAKGYFPKLEGIQLNSWSAPIDFTNPDARVFWKGLVDRYRNMGVDGFKLDYGEDIAPSLGTLRNTWGFADGSDERTMHNRYSALYHEAFAAPFRLCRAAHWGDHGCLIWPGDMDATFGKHGDPVEGAIGVGGLPATVIMGLSLGASGFPFFGADTGGYRHSPPDDELFSRWCEQTALSSVMQVGDASSMPPWTKSAQTLAIYKQYARLHEQLFPYAWSAAKEAVETGRPITRALGLAYPGMGVHPNDEYLFGEQILVAPVVERATSRTVIAPPGRWIDWWDGTPREGTFDYPAPLERLPLFVQEGAIIAMLRPTIDTLYASTDPAVESFSRDAGALWVRAFPGGKRSITVYDGTKLERDGSGSLALTPGSVFTKGFVVEVVGQGRPLSVTKNGTELTQIADADAAPEGWFLVNGVLHVKLTSGVLRYL